MPHHEVRGRWLGCDGIGLERWGLEGLEKGVREGVRRGAGK